MKTQDYAKIKTAIRYWMLGREYHVALKAMEFGLKYHTGLRKDGVMPEFQHQVSQASFARTLEPHLLYPDETLATIFLHDVVEDCDVDSSTIFAEFGDQVGTSVELMTNQVRGVKKPIDSYYSEMQFDAIASVVKGCDRIHNHQTMVDVFTPEKIDSYMIETNDHVIPMLKLARKRFTRQEGAYLNIKHVLMTQMELLQAFNPVEKSELKLD